MANGPAEWRIIAALIPRRYCPRRAKTTILLKSRLNVGGRHNIVGSLVRSPNALSGIAEAKICWQVLLFPFSCFLIVRFVRATASLELFSSLTQPFARKP